MRNTMKILIILACASLLVACNTAGRNPTASVDITATADAIRTESAQTVVADYASRPTATQLPSTATLAPSATEVPSATSAPTEVPVAATNTPPPTKTPGYAGPTITPNSYVCIITAFSPAYGASFSPGADFDARWTVKNTGSKTWSSGEIDYRFISGQAMHTGASVYDLPKNVAAGESIELIVDMLAPGSAGAYATTWSINMGATSICPLPVHIVVK
jgi:hypothetical protein